MEEIISHLDRSFKKTIRGIKVRCFNPTHPDKNPSGLIYYDGVSFHCFACGYHLTNYELAMTLGIIKGKDRPRELLPSPPMDYKEEVKKEVEKPKHFTLIEGEYLKLNITEEMAKIFKVGVCSAGLDCEYSDKCNGCFYEKNWVRDKHCGFAFGRVMIPIYKGGELLAIESRLLTKTIRSKKVLYPEGSRTSEVIFNYDNLDRNKPLYVTEGIKGALKVYRNIDKNVTAIFSNQLKGKQGDLIKEFSHVIIIPDLGAAGEITIKQFSELNLSNLEVVSLPEIAICRSCGKWNNGIKEKTNCQCGSDDTVYADVYDFEVEDLKSFIYNKRQIKKGSLIEIDIEEKKPACEMRKGSKYVSSRNDASEVGSSSVSKPHNQFSPKENAGKEPTQISNFTGSIRTGKNLNSPYLGCFNRMPEPR